MRRARPVLAASTALRRAALPRTVSPICLLSRSESTAPSVSGRLPADLPASESFDWLERRFEGGMLPARADLETAWGRIADEEELPGAFAAVKTYRVHAVPLTDLTARAIIDACMRVERPDIAVHVLNNKHLLRVWPAAPEYATVVGALLGSDRPLGDGGLSLAVTLCRGAARSQTSLHPETLGAVVKESVACLARIQSTSPKAAGREAAADAAGAADESGSAADADAEEREEGEEEEEEGSDEEGGEPEEGAETGTATKGGRSLLPVPLKGVVVLLEESAAVGNMVAPELADEVLALTRDLGFPQWTSRLEPLLKPGVETM